MDILEKANLLKEELDSLRPLSKDDEERIMQKFRLDWNYHSNHLEGNSLTYGETKALILFGITAQGKPLKDHFEITGHDEAIKWVIEVVSQQRPITENFIRELHKLILKEPYEVDAITPDGKPTKRKIEVGVYKTMPNHVKTRTGEIFRFATPEETPAKMHDLIAWYRSEAEKEDVNPIILAATFHYRFIRIHPFDDSNGRTARILMNFILMQFGYPPVIVKTEDKENYFSALRQADAGIISAFVQYIAQNLVHSLEIMIKGAKGENIEEEDDLEKEIALLKQKVDSTGAKVKLLKSPENIAVILDKSLKDLIRVFKEKGDLLTSLYFKNQFSFSFKKYRIPIQENDDLKRLKDEIAKNINEFSVQFFYETFVQNTFEGMNFASEIYFEFQKTKYEVKTSDHKLIYSKSYGDQLSKDEITNLVKHEIRRHKNAIEKRLNDLKK